MIIFHAPDIRETLTLPESDSAHAVRVLRMHEGDELTVADGIGSFLRCRITFAHPKKTMVEIMEETSVPQFWNGELILAVAPTKNMDRMEWLVEKVTEIGFNRLVPLVCRHSERKEIKSERLRKIAVSAMKQSLKATLPEIDDATPFAKFVREVESPQKFIAFCSDQFPRRSLAADYNPAQGAVLLVGPEGDFSPEEVEFAVSMGFVPVSLGQARLRTETAAFVGINTMHIIQQYTQ